ncbi:histidine phosphatase family protein [Rubellimicrobium aerolatum]
MDLPEILLARHGETEWNREGRFQGARDSDLTERGRAQALAMGEALRSWGVDARSHGAWTSPQGRARDTARLMLDSLGVAAEEEPDLVEIGMGAWTGLLRTEVEVRWPGPAGESLLEFYARCPGGEPLAEVATRAARVLARVRRPTVLVTHGITLRVLCSLALGRPLTEAGGYPLRQGDLVRIAKGRMEIVPGGAARLPGPAPAANHDLTPGG